MAQDEYKEVDRYKDENGTWIVERLQSASTLTTLKPTLTRRQLGSQKREPMTEAELEAIRNPKRPILEDRPEPAGVYANPTRGPNPGPGRTRKW